MPKQNSPRLIAGQSGMTLVEMMAGLAVSGVAIMAILAMMDSVYRSKRGFSQVDDWLEFRTRTDEIWNDISICTNTYTQYINPILVGDTIPTPLSHYGRIGYQISNVNRTSRAYTVTGDWSWGSIGISCSTGKSCINNAKIIYSADGFKMYEAMLDLQGDKKSLNVVKNGFTQATSYKQQTDGTNVFSFTKPIIFMTKKLLSGDEVLLSCGATADFKALRLCSVFSPNNFQSIDGNFKAADFPSFSKLVSYLRDSLMDSTACQAALGRNDISNLVNADTPVEFATGCGTVSEKKVFLPYKIAQFTLKWEPGNLQVNTVTKQKYYKTTLKMAASDGSTDAIDMDVFPDASGKYIETCKLRTPAQDAGIQGFFLAPN